MVDFYHLVCASSSQHHAPLFQAFEGKLPKLQWAEKMISAFNLAKEVLARASMLVHPHADAPTAITVDASRVAVGAALEQLVNVSWQPLAFFSRQLRPPERKNSTLDRELLAGMSKVRPRFRFHWPTASVIKSIIIYNTLQTRGTDLFVSVCSTVDDMKLPWDKVIGIITDGAPAMAG